MPTPHGDINQPTFPTPPAPTHLSPRIPSPVSLAPPEISKQQLKICRKQKARNSKENETKKEKNAHTELDINWDREWMMWRGYSSECEFQHIHTQVPEWSMKTIGSLNRYFNILGKNKTAREKEEKIKSRSHFEYELCEWQQNKIWCARSLVHKCTQKTILW